MLVRYLLKSKPLQSSELALGSGELREVLLFLSLSEQLLLTYQDGGKPAEPALGG